MRPCACDTHHATASEAWRERRTWDRSASSSSRYCIAIHIQTQEQQVSFGIIFYRRKNQEGCLGGLTNGGLQAMQEF